MSAFLSSLPRAVNSLRGGATRGGLLVGLLVGVGAAQLGFAQEAKSRPVGFLLQTIPAGQTRSFSVPFDADASSQKDSVGRLTAVGVNTFECAGARWVPGAFSLPAAPYFVRLTSGEQAGRIFAVATTANTASKLFLETEGVDLTTLGLQVGVAGAAFEVIPGDTLATFFGSAAAGHELVVQGSDGPNQADLVQIWSGAAWLRCYYNTVWRRWAFDTDKIGDPARDNLALRSDRGMLITRRANQPLDLAVVGRVLASPQRALHVRTENARTFLAPMQTGDVTLGALALQSPMRAAGWRAGSDAAQADLVAVWSGATWFTFFFNDQVGHWQREGESTGNRDDFLILAGTPVMIHRRTAASGIAERTVVFPPSGG